MSCSKNRWLLIVGFCLLSVSTFAGDIDKAFKYLNAGDYTNAQKYLREALNDEPDNAAVNYGLAKYFFNKDNPAHNLDSAIVYINNAAKKLPFNPEDKTTKKLLALGVRDYTIQSLQKSINFDAYGAAEQVNTFESYQHFIDNFNDKTYLEQAINFRNQKAYVRALSAKTPQALDEFVKKYPEATEMKEAKERYEKMLYEQTTADQTYQSYKKYLVTYPTGAYTEEAKKLYNEKLLDYYVRKNDLAAYIEFEKIYKTHPAYNAIQDSIYKLATKEGTVEAFKNFVTNYPQNRNHRDAWEQLYLLYTAEGTQNDYLTYGQTFPAAPNKERADRDLQLSALDIKPFQRDDKWGYAVLPATDSLVVPIPFIYEEAYEFNNGVAAVRIKPCAGSCTYYFIDKGNEKAFDAEFNYAGNFSHGYAIVGVGNCEEDTCKYGVINRRGAFVIAPEYDEINDPTEDLFMVVKDEKYGYLDKSGNVAISLKYTDALPFSQGLAAVGIDGNWFFIDKTGKQAFINRFNNVLSFSDSLAAVTQDGENWGYIDMMGNFVIQPTYESAEDFVGGFGIISKKEKDPKNKSMTISQRYKIDRTGKIIEKLTAPKEPKKSAKKKGRR
ncbi:MAG: WG repeat-containing protein [Chitinophagales bacterium]|nr:WG repeat-containing protein [Chitinophagales bacterium]